MKSPLQTRKTGAFQFLAHLIGIDGVVGVGGHVVGVILEVVLVEGVHVDLAEGVRARVLRHLEELVQFLKRIRNLWRVPLPSCLILITG